MAHQAGRLCDRLRVAGPGEGHLRRRRAVVVGDGVVGDPHAQRILQGHATRGAARHVVDDDVVEQPDQVPRTRGAARHIEAVHLLQTDTGTLTRAGVVALDQVGVDGDVAGTGRETTHRQRRRTADEDAAAVRIGALVEVLVEDDRVVGDLAAVGETQLPDAAAVTHGVIAADVVAGHQVIGRTVTQRYAAAGTELRAAVLRYPVVADTHVIIEGIRITAEERVGIVDQLRMADADTAAIGAVVAHHAVVGDFQEPRVAAGQDAAAVVGAGDGDAVDTGVAGVDEDMPVRCAAGGRVGGHHENPGPFFGAEQQRLVVGCVVTQGLPRQRIEGAIDTRDHGRLARIRIDRRAGRAVGDVGGAGRRTAAGIHLLVKQRAPVLQRQRARLGGVDGHGWSAPALQLDLLVHDHELVIGAGRDENEVAIYRRRRIDDLLDAAASGDQLRHTVFHRHRDTDLGGRTAGASHHQLPGGGVGRHRHGDSVGAPGVDRQSHAIQGDLATRPQCAETIVALDGLGGTGKVGVVIGIRHIDGADGNDRQRAASLGQVRAGQAVVADAIDLWRSLAEFAVERVLIAACIGRNRDHRCIKVGGLAGQILQRVAELAVLTAKERVDLRLRIGGAGDRIIGDRTRMVHARHHHVRSHARREWRVDGERGRHQEVEGAEFVRIHTGQFAARPVADRDRQVRRCVFLAEGGRVDVELARHVVEDEADAVAGHGRFRIEEEVGCRVAAGLHVEQLHVALLRRLTGPGVQRVTLLLAGEEAQELRHRQVNADAFKG